MAGFVEEIGQADYARGFAGEVNGERGRRTSKHANDGIQLAATPLQVGACDGEVRPIEGAGRDEEQLVLLIPEFVFPDVRLRNGDIRRGMRESTGVHSSFRNWALRERCRASHEGEEEN